MNGINLPDPALNMNGTLVPWVNLHMECFYLNDNYWKAVNLIGGWFAQCISICSLRQDCGLTFWNLTGIRASPSVFVLKIWNSEVINFFVTVNTNSRNVKLQSWSKLLPYCFDHIFLKSGIFESLGRQQCSTSNLSLSCDHIFKFCC